MVVGVVIIGVISIGATVDVDTSRIGPSKLLDANLLGWQLLYIIPVAVLTNDFFLSVSSSIYHTSNFQSMQYLHV